MKVSEYAMVIKGDCGAVLADARIQMPDGMQKRIGRITEKDYVLSAHDTKSRVESVCKCQGAKIYAIEASNGQCLKLTAEQCVLTKQGWKRARTLMPGNEIMGYDYQSGRAYFELVSVEPVLMKDIGAYTIALKEKTFIANGFICSDYDMQYGKRKIRRRNENVCK